jgi:spore maturation protein CgeB
VRIFYASGSSPNGALPASEIWRSNLYGALVDLGHDVIEFDYDLEPLIAAADTADPRNCRFVERQRPRASRELVAQVRRAHAEAPVDLFFSYFFSSCATPQAILDVRALGITTVNWYCNASYQLHLVEEIAPAYDACLVPERYRLDDYRRIGANPIYCQEAANPVFYGPRPLERDLDVVFVGARYGERPNYIRRLVDAGLDVRVFGPGWTPERLGRRNTGPSPRNVLGKVKARLERTAPVLSTSPMPEIPLGVCGGIVTDDELPAIYSRAKIALGFSSVGNTHASGERVTQVRLRDFEAPMCGAFYIVEHMPELGEFFDIDREVVTYRDIDELVEKCRYYLEHEDEREQIRLAGHERALRDHTWQRRFTDVFGRLGLSA